MSVYYKYLPLPGFTADKLFVEETELSVETATDRSVNSWESVPSAAFTADGIAVCGDSCSTMTWSPFTVCVQSENSNN